MKRVERDRTGTGKYSTDRPALSCDIILDTDTAQSTSTGFLRNGLHGTCRLLGGASRHDVAATGTIGGWEAEAEECRDQPRLPSSSSTLQAR